MDVPQLILPIRRKGACYLASTEHGQPGAVPFSRMSGAMKMFAVKLWMRAD